MSIKHSKYYWSAIKSESHIASGSGSVAYAYGKLSSLDPMPYPRTYGDNMFPFVRNLKEHIESNDDGMYGGIRVDSGKEIIEGSREDFVQDTFYLDHVIGNINKGFESLPDTYAIHWQDHKRDVDEATNNSLRFESYGCYVTELGFIINEHDGSLESFPSWKITDKCINSKFDDSDGVIVDSLNDIRWLSVSSNKPSVVASFSIDGVSLHNIEGELKIKVNYDETVEAGDNINKYPYLLGAEIEFTCTMRNYEKYKSFLKSFYNALAGDNLVVIKVNTGLTDTFIQVTDMKIDEASKNRIPEFGLESYELTFKSTMGTILSKTSS